MGKVELIRQEIESRLETNCYNDDSREELESLLKCIDSMKVEPKFKVGQFIVPKKHTEEPLEITEIKDGRYYDRDLHICDIKEQDQWELVEEPVSDKPKYTSGDVLYKKDDGSKIKIIDIVGDQYKFECGDEYPHYEFFEYIEYNYSKEPVSDDLEKAAREFIEPYREISECGIDYNIHPARVFKAGANWQLNKIRKENEKNRD
jgi:hypothetical protein